MTKIKKQIKSKERVASHGEVYTNQKEVKSMCDLVNCETERIDSRFLEPACGNGNFLEEILIRKLKAVKQKYKKSQFEYEKMSLLAISSLYGVDLLNDNVIECRKRLYKLWEKNYKNLYKEKCCELVKKSIMFILDKNIICGNALTLYEVDEFGKDTNKKITFSEWSFITGTEIQRSDFNFSYLIDNKSIEKSLYESSDEGIFIKKIITHYRKVWCHE